jgi:hypothetical protein
MRVLLTARNLVGFARLPEDTVHRRRTYKNDASSFSSFTASRTPVLRGGRIAEDDRLN